VLASGIFADREIEVTNAFGAAGLRVTGRTGEGDWVALELRRA
jgi:ribosomal protein L11 methylase PrmA